MDLPLPKATAAYTTPVQRGVLPRQHRATEYWKRDIVLKSAGDAAEIAGSLDGGTGTAQADERAQPSPGGHRAAARAGSPTRTH